MVKGWEREAASRRKHFTKSAQKIAVWDAEILAANKRVVHIAAMIHDLTVAHREVGERVGRLRSGQDRARADLEVVLGHVDTLRSRQGGASLGNDERKAAYDLMEDVGLQLDRMEGRIVEMNRELSSLEGSSEVAKILQVMNSHHTTLRHIDERRKEVKKKLDALFR